ncbi:MAG: hypothetical protein RL273_1405 [Bacteroidota bacterium]
MNYIFAKVALDSLIEITNFYESNQVGLGSRFVKSLQHHLETLVLNPKIGRYGRVSNTREFMLHDFPFIVAYRVKNNILEILQVIHQSSNYQPHH